MNMRFLLTAAVTVVMCACGQPAAEAKAEPEASPRKEVKKADPVINAGDAQIVPDKKLPKVIDFNAVWCPPCRRFGPIFHEVAAEMQGKAIFVSVDVDQAPTPAHQFGVESIPQISVLMPDGTVRSTVGFMDKDELIKFISLR